MDSGSLGATFRTGPKQMLFAKKSIYIYILTLYVKNSFFLAIHFSFKNTNLFFLSFFFFLLDFRFNLRL